MRVAHNDCDKGNLYKCKKIKGFHRKFVHVLSQDTPNDLGSVLAACREPAIALLLLPMLSCPWEGVVYLRKKKKIYRGRELVADGDFITRKGKTTKLEKNFGPSCVQSKDLLPIQHDKHRIDSDLHFQIKPP